MKNLIALGSTLALFLAGCSPVMFSKQSETTTNPSPAVSPQGSIPSSSPSPSPSPGASPSPGSSPSPSPGTLTVEYSFGQTVGPATQKVDVILIVDDSNSMASDSAKLASKMSGFLSSLQNSAGVDWQMCLTVTRPKVDANCTEVPLGTGYSAWGLAFAWQGIGTSPSYVLKTGASSIQSIVQNTIQGLYTYDSASGKYLAYACTNDERGIKSAYHHMDNWPSCYRSDAALAYILISDEDERSVGEHAADYQAMGELASDEANKPVDLTTEGPGALQQKILKKWPTKKMTFNSIVVVPPPAGSEKTKTVCKVSQDQDVTASATAKPLSRYGYFYKQASALMNGSVGSICDNDFSVNLNNIYTKVTNSLSSFALQCIPFNNVIRNLQVSPSMGNLPSYSISGATINFNPAIPEGSTVSFKYDCLQASAADRLRGIASAPESDESLWTKVSRWWQNLVSNILPGRTQPPAQ